MPSRSCVADLATIVTFPTWIDAEGHDASAGVVDVLKLEGNALSIVREVRSETCAQVVSWKRAYENTEDAGTAFDALNSRSSPGLADTQC